MKSILCGLMALVMITVCHGSIQISGDLTWKIKQPVCTFKLDGTIANLGQAGSVSGTLKLVLWATPAPFPSRGYAIAEQSLGQLSGGYQFNSFTFKTKASIPQVNGEYHFTIAVLEYTTSGWFTRAFVATGTRRMENGDLVTGSKWTLPTKPVVSPPGGLTRGHQLVLTPKALDNLNAIVPGTRANSKVVIRRGNKVKIVIAGNRVSATYAYSTGKASFNGANVSGGRVALKPLDASGDSNVTLFFLRSGGGIYRQVFSKATHWGTFTYK